MELNLLKTSSVDPFKVDELEYRGFSVKFYEDEISHQIYAEVNGEIVYFGIGNSLYIDDIKKLIDFKLDTIKIFKPYRAILLYFINGTHMHKDIKLVQDNRILAVYLSDDPRSLDDILLDAEAIAKKYFEKI